jgi:hypothetical protein
MGNKINIYPGSVQRTERVVITTTPEYKPTLSILSEKDYTVQTAAVLKGTDTFSLTANGRKVSFLRAGVAAANLFEKIAVGYRAFLNASKTGGRTQEEADLINNSINEYNVAVEHYNAVSRGTATKSIQKETLLASEIIEGSLEKLAKKA